MDYHDVTIAIDGSVTKYIDCNYGVKQNSYKNKAEDQCRVACASF